MDKEWVGGSFSAVGLGHENCSDPQIKAHFNT